MPKTILIIEGPDNCGKTNIASLLSDVLKIPVYKSGREVDAFKEKDAQYNILKWGVYEQLKMVETYDSGIIFDRFFPSEFVYSKVYNRKSDIELIKKYDKDFNRLGGKIIFLDKQIMDGEDELIHENQYQEIREQYKIYKNEITSCDYITIDTTDRNEHMQLTKLLPFVYKGEKWTKQFIIMV